MVEILWDLRWFRVAARLAQWLSYPSSAALHHQHDPLQMLSLVSRKHHQACPLLLLCIIKQISSNFHFAIAEILPHVVGLVKKTSCQGCPPIHLYCGTNLHVGLGTSSRRRISSWQIWRLANLNVFDSQWCSMTLLYFERHENNFSCRTIGNEYHRVGQVDVISRKRMWHAINCSQLKGPSTFFYPPDMRLLTVGVAPAT